MPLNHESEPWLQFLHPTEIVIDIDNSQMAIMTNTPRSGGSGGSYYGMPKIMKPMMATHRLGLRIGRLAVVLAMADGSLPIGDIIAVSLMAAVTAYAWYDYFS